MRATIAGLQWDIASPSHYRLVPPIATASTIDVSFLGDRWYLFLEANGRVRTESFPPGHGRDAALAKVVRCFQELGAI